MKLLVVEEMIFVTRKVIQLIVNIQKKIPTVIHFYLPYLEILKTLYILIFYFLKYLFSNNFVLFILIYFCSHLMHFVWKI